MIDEILRSELLAMQAEDFGVRAELAAADELGGPYVPRMEAVHIKNAARLRELIARHGWPSEDTAGKDGAEAAWLIAQHAVGEPEFQRRALKSVLESANQGRTPAWHAAYLEDRIAMSDGRPQRFGTQWLDDPRDGQIRPWKLADPERVNELRAGVGLSDLRPVPEYGPDLPADQREAIRENYRWWQEWKMSKGWPLDRRTWWENIQSPNERIG
jgi:hypothetical protein